MEHRPLAEVTDAQSRGLSDDEFTAIVAKIGRRPNLPELAMFSAMWNEHCSYKSSRRYLRRLPTTGARVICGPGENAGAVELGDGLAAVFKMESHNHPSFIEPYQGAATGVGGILRDVFTMGAEPIACLNALRFGDPAHPRTKALLRGVVAGVGGYGNSFGVPTVGGELNFDRRYNGNILVNAMAVGIAPADKLFTAKAPRSGCKVLYAGAPTGRDGIHGASMASDAFSSDDTQAKRPTVQVGDPFTGRLLMQASLALMASGAVAAVQDMGAAGLTCSAVEPAASGGLGITLHLEQVPVRAAGMSAEEMLLSETQERMLFILNEGHEDAALALLQSFGIAAAVVGQLDNDGLIKITHAGVEAVRLPVSALVEAPEYERPTSAPVAYPPLSIVPSDPVGIVPGLLTLLSSFDGCSRAPVFERYDSLVRGNTLQGPGGDAAVLRVHQAPSESNLGIAVTCDVTPRYCSADPFAGAAQAVCESYRNLCAVGAEPLAITDNLNFGNVREPEVMGEFSAAIDGIAFACKALAIPVVSGNVSLYNATDGVSIPPTPAIGAVGKIADVRRTASIALQSDNASLLLVGTLTGHLGSSWWLRAIHDREDGAPPAVDPGLEKRTGTAVRELIAAGVLRSVHDVSDGGLLVAAAEMLLASDVPEIGLHLKLPKSLPAHAAAFGEDQAMYLLAVSAENDLTVRSHLQKAGLQVTGLGTVTRDGELQITDHGAMKTAIMRQVHQKTLREYLKL